MVGPAVDRRELVLGDSAFPADGSVDVHSEHAPDDLRDPQMDELRSRASMAHSPVSRSAFSAKAAGTARGACAQMPYGRGSRRRAAG
jgi:hypothetical protein